MKMRFFLVLCLVSFSLVGCSARIFPPDDPLGGTSWELASFQKTGVMEGIKITANFEEGQVSGSASCNSYFGAYQIDKKRITFGPIANTEMACLDPEGVMVQEAMFLAWLMDATTYELKGDQLVIFRTNGEALIFVPEL